MQKYVKKKSITLIFFHLSKDIFLSQDVIQKIVIFHGSDANLTSLQRRAFSMRFIGDDVKYLKRNGPTSPPFDGINLLTGERMRTDWFPEVFNS